MPDSNPVNDQRISLFLRKLWTLVNSPETDNVIKWNEVSSLFVALDELRLRLALRRVDAGTPNAAHVHLYLAYSVQFS